MIHRGAWVFAEQEAHQACAKAEELDASAMLAFDVS